MQNSNLTKWQKENRTFIFAYLKTKLEKEYPFLFFFLNQF